MTDQNSSYCAPVSVRGRHWSQPENVRPPAALPDGVTIEAAQIALRRGAKDLDAFFKPKLKGAMPDPLTLKSMAEAAERFCAAVRAKEMIAVYGDYDVDGATSSSIIMRWLGMVGHEQAFFYIPDRMKEGYGPNAAAMEKIAAEGAKLIVIVDSGTTAFDPLERARDVGLDVVILDHHEPHPEKVPYGILVNPKRKDEDRAYEYLCTAGLAFLFLVCVSRMLRESGYFQEGGRREPDLRDLLGIVALGTVADVVPLVGLNRAYVSVGLPRMTAVLGLRALSDATGESAYTAKNCGFIFGPCINAAGRIDDTRLGTLLLTTEDESQARELAQKLVAVNEERRDMQRKMVESAIKQASDSGLGNHGVVVMYDPDWHPGVVGLVAAKVKDAFDRPTVIIGEKGKASCRSVDGFDIGNAVISAREAGLLIAGGGHAAAAGLTVDPARIDELRAFMNAQAEGFKAPAAKVDVAVQCGALRPQNVHDISTLAPFGQGNPEPRVVVFGGHAQKVMVLKEKHVKVILAGRSGRTEAMIFNGIGTRLGDALAACEGRRVDLLGRARIDTYGGVEKVQLMPEDAMIGENLEG